MVYPLRRMAPKGPAVSSLIQPKVLKQEKIKLDDVDVSEESGWQELNAQRVQDLVNEFLLGIYGLKVLKDPMIRCVNGVPKLATSGKAKLGDGKHKSTALKQCQQIYEDANECDQHQWSAQLVAVFADGEQVSFVEWPEDDDDLVLAYNTAAHEEGANKAMWSDLKDLANVANRYKAKTPGRLWLDVQKNLENLFPSGKRILAYRMVVVAKEIPPEVLEAISLARLPTSYFLENSFFLGTSANQDKKISAKGCLQLVETLREQLDQKLAR